MDIHIGRRTQVAKGEVCKTFMQRFESARRLRVAQVVELVDTRDLKSLERNVREGSSPSLGKRGRSSSFPLNGKLHFQVVTDILHYLDEFRAKDFHPLLGV